jgi:hypothetical protein
VITPVTPSRDRPAGNAPNVTANVGAGEPSADTNLTTATPTVNEPNEPETTVGATVATTEPENVAAAEPATFVAVISNE